MNIFLATLKVLKLPLKLLISKPKPKKTELEQKCWKHVQNFSTRHYSWQRSIGKKPKKNHKKNKKYCKNS